MQANIFVIQINNYSIRCEYLCIRFIDFVLAGKTLNDYAGLLWPYEFRKNVKIILNYIKKQ